VDESKRLEIDIENRFIDLLERNGWITMKGSANRGFSDRFCFSPTGHTIIVEFKRLNPPKKRKGEKLQDYYRKQFREREFECHKVEGLEEAITLAQTLLQQTPVFDPDEDDYLHATLFRRLTETTSRFVGTHFIDRPEQDTDISAVMQAGAAYFSWVMSNPIESGWISYDDQMTNFEFLLDRMRELIEVRFKPSANPEKPN